MPKGFSELLAQHIRERFPHPRHHEQQRSSRATARNVTPRSPADRQKISPHEIPRRSQGLYPLRRRRERLRVVPAREVRRVRRPERRRRRHWRRRDRGGGRGPQHPDRLPLPAAFQGQERRRRHGQGSPWRQRRRHRAQGAGRHPDLRGGRRDPAGRPREGRRPGHAGARAATAASATRASRARPTGRRATPTRASPARSAPSACA